MKKWTKDEIKSLLASNDVAVIKGLIRIYELQTSDEQNAEFTKYHNGVGFSGFDGEFMTSVAKWFLEHGFVTEGQFRGIKKKMMRYAGQLAKLANGEIVPDYREEFKIYEGWLRKKNA
jgi:hypothetical protein